MKWLLAFSFLVYAFSSLFLKKHDAYLNVYDWYGMIPQSVISEFEKETGIKINYDMYQDNDTLEAKLLASNPGYDLVFPSATPYAARQIKAGVYRPLDKSKLPNIKGIFPFLKNEMKKIEHSDAYVVPIYWGTIGIIYDENIIPKILPAEDLNSVRLLFDIENLKKLSACGVSFLEEACDVIPFILLYLGYDINSRSIEELENAAAYLKKIRPYLRRFSSTRIVNDIVTKDLCIGQAWSGEFNKALRAAHAMGKKVRFFIPEEGSKLWVDCAGIPKGSSNPNNAHMFLNFLLRPDIAARLTSYHKIPTSVAAAKDLIKENLEEIYPPEEIILKLHLEEPNLDAQGTSYEKLRSHFWSRARLG